MRPDHRLTLQRVPFAQALRTLTPREFQLLTLLALDACPTTRRVWTTPLRLAEAIDLASDARAPAAIDGMLGVLLARGHLSLDARSHGALRCYEVPMLLARVPDAAPDNLPVGPDP